MGKYFGVDDIRGKAYSDVTPLLIKKVGRALGCFNISNIIVGCDTRESSMPLKEVLIETLKWTP